MWCWQDQYYGSVAKKETIKIIETLLQKDTFDRGRCGFLISPAISFLSPDARAVPWQGLCSYSQPSNAHFMLRQEKKSPFSAS